VRATDTVTHALRDLSAYTAAVAGLIRMIEEDSAQLAAL
jgi:hypothetical protein